MKAPRRRILIRSPEIRIKGRNRSSFREALKRNLGRRLRGVGLDWRPRSVGDRVFIEVAPGAADAEDRALEAVATVFGVELALPAEVLGRKGSDEALLERIVDRCCALAASAWAPGGGFALRVKRRDPQFALRSRQIAEAAGRAILDRTDWERVDLSDPAFTIYIESHEEAVYLWTRRVRGPGGLPVGAAGRLLGLLSGGFDSPVAAWMMASRGAALDFLHLTPARADPEGPAAAKAVRLARALTRYTGRSRLVLVPYTHFDLQLTGSRTGYEALLFRRFAFRCGEAAARRFGSGALVTGDSLSQVASQTLENLISADAAVALPVLRPLVGSDKRVIMKRADQIGTGAISAVPAKDCCALISGAPRTKSRAEHVAALESRLVPDPDGLVGRSLAESVVGVFEGGEAVGEFVPGRDLFAPEPAPARGARDQDRRPSRDGRSDRSLGGERLR